MYVPRQVGRYDMIYTSVLHVAFGDIRSCCGSERELDRSVNVDQCRNAQQNNEMHMKRMNMFHTKSAHPNPNIVTCIPMYHVVFVIGKRKDAGIPLELL